MKRFFSKRQRQLLAMRAAGLCTGCSAPLPPDFHADHRHPHSQGGATILANGQALCPTCNIIKGTKVVQLRTWQIEAHDKAIAWLAMRGEDRHFLLNAAPGSGKILVSCVIANTLIKQGLVERVVVIAPRTEVVNQWASEFSAATGRHMNRITGQDAGFHAMGLDVCATWAAISALKDGFQQMCEASSVLVICDEHHHAAVAAAWGETADSAFAEASYVLVLTGTPVRSDGAQAIWLPYHEGGIAQPEAGTYTLTYGDAVDLAYCRPVTFHRHEGRFRIALEDGTELRVSGRAAAEVPDGYPEARLLRRALDFQTLAGKPQVDAAGVPRLDSYHATMVDWATAKLDELRRRMPRAGGLVIAPSIEMAQYFARIIEMKEGTPPILVHSQMANAESRINAFRRTGTRWIVSVAMISEGVDIPRLRVLIYLPSAMTEVAFRQAVGRVVLDVKS